MSNNSETLRELSAQIVRHGRVARTATVTGLGEAITAAGVGIGGIVIHEPLTAIAVAAAGAAVIFSASIYGLTVDRRIRAIEAYRKTLLNQTISELPEEQFEPTLKTLTEINEQFKKVDFLHGEDNEITFTTVFESFKKNKPALS